MTFRNCVAVDLGASSGRVMLARYERECRSLTLREIHRFKNGLHSQNGYVTWNVDSLESAIRLGLNKVCEEGIRIDSIGIDTGRGLCAARPTGSACGPARCLSR